MMDQITKICTKCGEEKGLSNFTSSKTSKYGVRPDCKECRKEYRRNNYLKSKLIEIEYTKKISKVCKTCGEEKSIEDFNKASLNTDGKKNICRVCDNLRGQNYYANNKEKMADTHKRYYEENKDKILQHNKEYREEHWEEYLIYSSIFQKKNRHKYRAKSRAAVVKYKTTKIKACPIWSDIEKIKLIYKEREYISKNTGIEHHVDHIIPIQGELVCGLHVPRNLRIIPAKENMSKSNKLIEELL